MVSPLSKLSIYDKTKKLDEFVKKLRAGETGGNEWQRHYFQGKYVNGDKCPYSGNLRHRTKLDLDDPGKNK